MIFDAIKCDTCGTIGETTNPLDDIVPEGWIHLSVNKPNDHRYTTIDRIQYDTKKSYDLCSLACAQDVIWDLKK